MSFIRPIDAATELRRSIGATDTDIPVISTDAFRVDARKLVGDEFVQCSGLALDTLGQPVMTGCQRGISREDGGSAARDWPGGTPVYEVGWTVVEIVTALPTPTLAMVGRDFTYQDPATGISYRFTVRVPDGVTPIIVWIDSPPPDTGISFLWASQITGLTSITGVAFDASGNVYTGSLNTTATFKKFNSGLVNQWSALVITDNLATDGTTVFGTGSSSVQRRLASTGAAASPASWGTFGTGAGQFDNPRGVVTDSTNVWVVDRGNNRVQKFGLTGTYVSQFDGSSSGIAFNAPTGIAIGPTSTHLYVLDPGNGRVVKFLKSDHSWVATFAFGIGVADGQISSTAEGITVTSDGRIWIADTGNHRIEVFTSAGVWIGSFGNFGGGDGEFKSPKQLAASGAVVFVADSGNNRLVTVQEKLGITPVVTERAGSTVTVAATSTNAGTATCNAGEISVGGGFGVVTGTANMVPITSRRSGTTAWQVAMRNNGAGSNTFTPYVECLAVPLS